MHIQPLRTYTENILSGVICTQDDCAVRMTVNQLALRLQWGRAQKKPVQETQALQMAKVFRHLHSLAKEPKKPRVPWSNPRRFFEWDRTVALITCDEQLKTLSD